ncbi:MAG: hypothetical protein ABJK37_06950 [Paraglaciecola sp.]|uniref:hypothetical protein n=1 Tax=Paraglaciecola sp. TaxID=1920173 RepID=UPI0032982670
MFSHTPSIDNPNRVHKMRTLSLRFTAVLFGLQLNVGTASEIETTLHKAAVQTFYTNVMSAEPAMPADLNDPYISCALGKGMSGAEYKTAQQVDYNRNHWQQRVASDWQYFEAPKSLGRVLAIDFAKKQNADLGFRYLANADSYDELYEPWSSSKIQAFTAAISKMRTLGVGANSLAGDVHLADLITSIHSYESFGKADGDSNAIATYFLNVIGRDEATALFHEKWLKLNNNDIRFRGAYGTKAFSPSEPFWRDLDANKKIQVPAIPKSTDDSGYQSYRCASCGLTGNKPMTTLSQAEWLKRLASHERVAQTRMPNLTAKDVEVLFYGSGHSDNRYQVGGMLQGISRMLLDAVAKNITHEAVHNSKLVLDEATNERWRIWQKIGWGPSETRGTGENVVLAHVCLPDYQGGREFTISAQTSYPGNTEKSVHYAGLKMQLLLDQALAQLLNSKPHQNDI